MYAVMWSEHCSYKSSRALPRSRFPTDAPWVLVGPGEGAGVVDIGDGLAVAVRIESHNHPSAVEPYQGAATGVGGIIRDIFSMGARPIALMDPLRFGSLDDARTRYLFEGVVSGISGYGNSVGVPTVGGEVVFDDTLPRQPARERVVPRHPARSSGSCSPAPKGPATSRCCSARSTGRDGIGGASVLASAGFEEGDEAKRPSVQVGDPFEEKRLIEACLELLDREARGRRAGPRRGRACRARRRRPRPRAASGMDVDVARVAKREPGMNAVEVMTSESQERMLAIVEPAALDAVLELARKLGDPRDGRRARHRHRSVPRLRRRVRRGRCARREPRRRRSATSRPRSSSDAPPVADVPVGSLGDGPLYHRPRRAARRRRTRCRPTIPRRGCAPSSRAGADLARRAARAARDADDRRQDVGLAPVRPPAVPQHRRRARAPTPRCCA